MTAAVAERTVRLKVIGFPKARKLHVADPSERTQSLCGREGDAFMRGYLEEHPAADICKGCRDEAAALVRVVTPDPVTGEAVEQLRARSYFKPEQPEEVIPKDFKDKVLACERPTLKWSGFEEPPVEVGQVIPLTNSVVLTIKGLSRTKKGEHIAHYAVDDDRPALPRRVPAMFQPPEFDHLSIPIPHTKESIAAATIDGNYTQDPNQAVTGVGPEVDVEYRRVLGVRRRMKQSEQKRREDPMGEAERDVERLNRELKQVAKRAVKMGVDPVATIAPIQRAIEEAHANLSEESAAA